MNAVRDCSLASRLAGSRETEVAIEARLTSSNPLDAVPVAIPFDVPYGLPISLDQTQEVIRAGVAEAKKRNWKMNVAVVDSRGNLVHAFGITVTYFD